MTLTKYAVGYYYLDVCRSGLFEGCATVRFIDCAMTLESALKKGKVAKGSDGKKYALDNGLDGPIKEVSEEEAYDIVCGKTDMSFAQWGTYW